MMATKTPPTKEQARELSTPNVEMVQRKRAFFGRAQKVGLICCLCAGLSVILMLHMNVGHTSPIPGSSPVTTTCADLLNSTDYTKAVGFQPDSQQMAAIQMVNDLDAGAPAALVQVTTPKAQNALAVYVFGCTLEHQQPQLVQLFGQQGLPQGTVSLTPAHTLVTAALDPNLSPNDIPFLQPMQQNIYYEYAWQAGRFVQVRFPGFYPVASRVEAEALQQSFNNGQKLSWNDPLTTAQQMTKDLLQWSDTPQARLVSQTNDTALVELTSQNPRMTIEVTLQQIIQPGSQGLWFVTDARTKGMLITRTGTVNEPLPQTMTSPMSFSGANALIDGKTTATLFDHTLTPLKQSTNVPLNVLPDSTYDGTLNYSGLLRGQQGAILIESLPQPENQGKEEGQLVLTSVILG